MKNFLGGVALAGLAFFATPVAAAQILATVNGTLTSSLGEFGFFNTGVDAHLATGSPFTLTAQFDSSLLVPWGSFGYSIVGLYGLPTSGASYFRIDAPALTWQASDSLGSGAPFYNKIIDAFGSPPHEVSREAAPALVIQGTKVIGLIGDLSPSASTRPEIYLGSSVAWATEIDHIGYPSGPATEFDNLVAANLSNAFRIDAPNGLYGNIYNTPGFNGIWDFSGSSVVGMVPEPATWCLFLLGFGGIGWLTRRKRSVPLPD